MRMALPPVKNATSTDPTPAHEAILDALERGETPPEIAKRLAKGDKRLAKKLRAKIWRMARGDAEFQRHVAERARAAAVVGLPAAMAGQSRRASRGRTDAARFIAEATGFHNPRVQHEHSGDIKITIDMPRPKFVDAEAIEE